MKLGPKSCVVVLRRAEGMGCHTERKFCEDGDTNEMTAGSPEMSKVASTDARERIRHISPRDC